MIDFTPTSAVELRPPTREMMGRFALSVDVLYTDLADVGKPILAQGQGSLEKITGLEFCHSFQPTTSKEHQSPPV